MKALPFRRRSYDYSLAFTRARHHSEEDSRPRAIRPKTEAARLEIGVDAPGGASVGFRAPIVERYGIDIQIVNDTVDPTFRFMSLDWDGRVRMDGSSPYAMAPLVGLEDRFDIAFGNDPDADRHGIVTRGAGLMNPNQYAVELMARTGRDASELHGDLTRELSTNSRTDRSPATSDEKGVF